jgi:hypothetical protein
MEKIVHKFRSFEEAVDADYEYYRTLSGNKKLQLLLDLIMPENRDAAIIERSPRVESAQSDCLFRFGITK